MDNGFWEGRVDSRLLLWPRREVTVTQTRRVKADVVGRGHD